jgi:hypothetical protein
MPLSSHTTAGAGQRGTLLRSQPEGGKRTADLCRPAPWTLSGCRPGCVWGRFNKSEDCPWPEVGLPSRESPTRHGQKVVHARPDRG